MTNQRPACRMDAVDRAARRCTPLALDTCGSKIPLVHLAAGISLALVLLTGCEREARERAREASEETSVQTGGALTISSDQQTAIGLRTGSVAARDVRKILQTTGWLVARPDSEVVVKAPLTGFIQLGDKSAPLAIGQQVSQQQSLATLQVFLSPQEEAQIVAAKEDADTVIRQSIASLKTAQEQLARLEQEMVPLEGESVPVVRKTRLQELQEIIAKAQAARDEALEKLPFLPVEPYGDRLQLGAVTLPAPIDGRIVRVEVSPRQLVLQGDPLCTVADWSKLWVRVPVFAADLPGLQRQQPADLSLPGTRRVYSAVPVDWPQPTEPGRQTVDLFYEIDNSQASLRPGQAIDVSLPQEGTVTRLVVPQSAILWESDGNAAVYVRTQADQFRRRKVALGPIVDDYVVVHDGLKEGDVIVTTGAEALYGEEFRWQIPREDEGEE